MEKTEQSFPCQPPHLSASRPSPPKEKSRLTSGVHCLPDLRSSAGCRRLRRDSLFPLFMYDVRSRRFTCKHLVILRGCADDVSLFPTDLQSHPLVHGERRRAVGLPVPAVAVVRCSSSSRRPCILILRPRHLPREGNGQHARTQSNKHEFVAIGFEMQIFMGSYLATHGRVRIAGSPDAGLGRPRLICLGRFNEFHPHPHMDSFAAACSAG